MMKMILAAAAASAMLTVAPAYSAETTAKGDNLKIAQAGVDVRIGREREGFATGETMSPWASVRAAWWSAHGEIAAPSPRWSKGTMAAGLSARSGAATRVLATAAFLLFGGAAAAERPR